MAPDYCNLLGFQGGDCFSEEFLQAVDCLRDGLGHLNQRWKDGLAFNNAGLIEKYLSGRFSIVLYFDSASTKSNRAQSLTGSPSEREVYQTILVVIDNIDVIDCLGNDHGYKESVLVSDVELVEGPKKTVRSLVRAYYLDNEITNADYEAWNLPKYSAKYVATKKN